MPADDPLKDLEIGSEATPGEFIDTLLDVTEACARVLAPHGSLVFELGDTFSGSGGAGGDYAEDGLRKGQPKFRQGTPRWDGRPAGQVRTTTSDPVSYPSRGSDGWPLDKSLTLIPETYRFALVYGFNPHTGRQTPRWRARNVIRWVRPNPPVGALGDKFRPATSEMVVACKAKDRWFDLDAVRTPHMATDSGPLRSRAAGSSVNGGDAGAVWASGERGELNPAGAPPLDWWSISPAGFAGAHYATWPPELCIRPIEAMCPRRVCIACGKPSRRIAETTNALGRGVYRTSHVRAADGVNRPNAEDINANAPDCTERTTTGWSSCGCPGTDGIRLDGFHTGPGWRPGVVLDPFCGTFTTGVVAHGHGRDSIGVDLDARNADLARERLGMFLDVETMPRERPIIDYMLDRYRLPGECEECGIEAAALATGYPGNDIREGCGNKGCRFYDENYGASA